MNGYQKEHLIRRRIYNMFNPVVDNPREVIIVPNHVTETICLRTMKPRNTIRIVINGKHDVVYLVFSFLIAGLIYQITAVNSGDKIASTLGTVIHTLETAGGIPDFSIY